MPLRRTAGARSLSVAFVVPLQGPTGIYGPSCLACGELAVEQLNARDGIAGREIELVVVDGGRDPEVVAAEVGALVDSGAVEAVAGWHISAVRQAITRRIGGKVVYAYAAMHEGRDDTPGVFMLGERPSTSSCRPRTGCASSSASVAGSIVGNDYVFPRVTGATARLRARATPPRRSSARPTCRSAPRTSAPCSQELEPGDVDGVIMLLMGQDAVHFNRQFARHGLADRLTRLSPAVEENTLLGGGAGANQQPVRRGRLLRQHGHRREQRAGRGPTTGATAPGRRR